MTFSGSSPLTRGKPAAGEDRRRRSGLIPAHAGKTAPAARERCPREAHPRSRGENRMDARSSVSPSGSSPLTRGKLQRRQLPADHRRLIPAHAGKTPRQWSGSGGGAAHPRSRGENSGRWASARYTRGSSPLTRGKRPASAPTPTAAGLIPAHAGKTRPISSTRQPRPAHPRSRGENELNELIGFSEQGSSPLTRGKPAAGEDRRRRTGLIPAHAGKTVSISLLE